MSEECYGENKYRGVAIIINNVTFSPESRLSDRSGAEKDLHRMKNMFEILGFHVRPYKDLTAAQMRQKMEMVASLAFHEYAECFACVINTHGEEDVHHKVHGHENKEHMLYGKDGELVSTRELLQIIASCRNLKGKPKLFFIQACRTPFYRKGLQGFDEGAQVKVQYGNVQNIDQSNSDQNDRKDAGHIPSAVYEAGCFNRDDDKDDDGDGSNDEFLEKDKEKDGGTHPEGSRERTDGIDTTPREPEDSITQVPCFNDMLVMFASPQGQFAIRNQEKGSYFLYYLHTVTSGIVDNMEKGYIKKWPGLLNILIQVSKEIASQVETNVEVKILTKDGIQKHRVRGKCIPCIVSRLRKDFVMLPKVETKRYVISQKYLI